MCDYENLARELGFTEAVFLEHVNLECEPELRAFCNPEQCSNYGHSWVCPPGCGTLEECREKLCKFHRGLLLQSVSDLMPPTSKETYAALAADHSTRLKKLVDVLRPENAHMLVLSYGGCNLCPKCSYPEPCIRPQDRTDSLGAYGIDVGKLCESANLPFSFREDKLYLTALILLEQQLELPAVQ